MSLLDIRGNESADALHLLHSIRPCEGISNRGEEGLLEIADNAFLGFIRYRVDMKWALAALELFERVDLSPPRMDSRKSYEWRAAAWLTACPNSSRLSPYESGLIERMADTLATTEFWLHNAPLGTIQKPSDGLKHSELGKVSGRISHTNYNLTPEVWLKQKPIDGIPVPSRKLFPISHGQQLVGSASEGATDGRRLGEQWGFDDAESDGFDHLNPVIPTTAPTDEPYSSDYQTAYAASYRAAYERTRTHRRATIDGAEAGTLDGEQAARLERPREPDPQPSRKAPTYRKSYAAAYNAAFYHRFDEVSAEFATLAPEDTPDIDSTDDSSDYKPETVNPDSTEDRPTAPVDKPETLIIACGGDISQTPFYPPPAQPQPAPVEPIGELRNYAAFLEFEQRYPSLEGDVVLRAKFRHGFIVGALRRGREGRPTTAVRPLKRRSAH